MARVQVNDLRYREALQPTPIQSDTHTGADIIQDAGRNYFALADALGSFSTSLSRLHKTQKGKKKDDPTMENLFARLTVDERAQVARTGYLPDGTKIGERPGLMKAAGSADAIVFNRQLQKELQNDFDWENTDVDAYLTQRGNEYLDQSGIQDPFARKGFLEKFNQLRSTAYREQHEYRQKRADEYTGDVVFKNMEDMVYSWIEEGQTPEDVHKSLRKAYADFGKKGSIGMNYERLDAYTLSIAANIAESNPEYALELIHSKRPGAGPASSPIASKVKHKNTVAAITGAAKKAIIKREADETERGIYEGDVRSVLEEGDYSAFEEEVVIPEGDESPRRITREQRNDNFVQGVLRWSDRRMKEDKISQRAMDREIVPVFQKKGLEHPYIKDEIDGIETRVSPDTLADPNQLEDIQERINRYRDMRSISPAYVNSQLSDDTKEFLGVVDNMIRYKRLDLPRAIIMAEKAYNADPAAKASIAFARPDIMKAVRDGFDRYGLTNSTGYDTFNMSSVTARVEEYARTLIATGEYSYDEAIEQAVEDTAKTMPVFRGKVLTGMEQYPMAPNWQAGAEAIVTEAQSQVAPAFEDTEMFLTHQGGGRFGITDPYGVPLLNKDGKPMATNIWEINEMASKVGPEEAIEESVKEREVFREQRQNENERPTEDDQNIYQRSLYGPSPFQRGR